ncbi:hypothetical protein GQ457_14G017070 [Hibiscus cannabinus]
MGDANKTSSGTTKFVESGQHSTHMSLPMNQNTTVAVSHNEKPRLGDQLVREFVISPKAFKKYLLLIKEPNNKKIRKMEIAHGRWTATWEGRLQHCLVGQVSYMWSLLGQN